MDIHVDSDTHRGWRVDTATTQTNPDTDTQPHHRRAFPFITSNVAMISTDSRMALPRTDTHTHAHRHTKNTKHTKHTHVLVRRSLRSTHRSKQHCISIYIYVCVCVCVEFKSQWIRHCSLLLSCKLSACCAPVLIQAAVDAPVFSSSCLVAACVPLASVRPRCRRPPVLLVFSLSLSLSLSRLCFPSRARAPPPCSCKVRNTASGAGCWQMGACDATGRGATAARSPRYASLILIRFRPRSCSIPV